MFEYPKIHEIRSAPDMVHPASTPENPITAAYVLVIRDRSPEEYIDDEFLDWNYILWWRRNDAFNRELCLALRAETLVPDGEPRANDKFLEFRKDKLRFGDGKNHIRRSPDAPDLHEIGAAAEGFMAALYSTPLRSIAPKTRRCLPDLETSPVLLESGLRLYNLHRGREHISVSIGVPSAGGQQADRILGRVRFDEFEYSPEFGRLSAIPACGVDERLVDFLRDYGVGSYESNFDLNTLFSTQCLARLQVGRDPGLAFGRTLQKWIASWNSKPPGKGPFNDSRASQRARRVLGKPKDGQTLYLKSDSLPSSSLEAILQRFAPKRKLDQTIRVSCWPEPTSFHRYRQQSKAMYDRLYVQLFAVIDESGRSVVVFDGRLRFGRINPEVAQRMRRAYQRHQEALNSQETDGQVAILKATDESAFHIMLSDFLRIDSRDNRERPMTVEDFADDVAIENFTGALATLR
jgi:hypothetical protein